MRKPTHSIQLPTNLAPSFSLKTIPNFHFLPFPSKPTKLSFRVFSSRSADSPPPPSSTQNLTLISILRTVPDWADAIKERGMQQKRSLYNHETWVEHRSSRRHVRHLLSSFSSRVILSLIPPVIAFTSVAVIVASYNSAVTFHWLPEFFPLLRASSLPYQLTAPALALLLVFRTEASYSRFEEGRKAWTKIIAGTNDFARQVIAGVESSGDALLKKALLQYIMAFPVVLKCHVIYGSDIRQDLQNLLEVDDLAVVLSSKHRPRCIIEFISQSLQLLNLDDAKRHVLESKLSCFHEGIGVCEQLMGIPIPLSYTRLTSRFLVLWHLTLPIILWEDCNWIVVPATFISAASLFCIEEVGVLIEEPFPMLALDELCKLVHNNIQEAIASEKLIQAQLIAKRKNHADEHSPNGRPSSEVDRKLG
ncbi:UPF0187 protein At3g61320, chloroplastic-like [Vitis riparia]|uniref:UPF0187 protein At3g61320, chloroplastic-like n=1 Tax=Vitis riparia TaxID=96939 RepID=UPI00155B02F6|nr:UPF0187 protein At3g61320, chloroplastic-like [Vitis riparia]